MVIGLSLRVRLLGALDRDPDRHPACDRRLDRADERPFQAALALPRDRRGARGAPLRAQLHPPLRDGTDRHPRRGADARAALPGLPAVSARVLRPACNRPGRLARDQRPLPHPVLHRLGHDAGHPVGDDDHRDRGRPVLRQRQAGGGRADRDAGGVRARLHVRAQGDADLARGAAAEGRCHRGCGRGRGRDRDGAGVRPRGRRAGALRRKGRARPRRRAAPGSSRGGVPAGPVVPPDASRSPQWCSSEAAT